jgi:hypothetical protein
MPISRENLTANVFSIVFFAINHIQIFAYKIVLYWLPCRLIPQKKMLIVRSL